ncbi:MAG: amidohydrolase [Phycisphaerales bacterium]|nr:amidohydrolase [Phycisphaerales bacterium]
MIDCSQLKSLIARELPSLIALRHDLHAHPELGLEEHRTSQVIQRELAAAEVAFVAQVGGGTGVIGHLPGGAAKAVALRADIDALPITEETRLPYASTYAGVMHACGHDGHTTILIGAARVLAKLAAQKPLPRPVTFVFQPAEENLGGASRMIADGCLTGRIGPAVSDIYALHAWPWLPLHTVGVRVGPILASTDSFTVHVRGRGSHAAWPHLAHDPAIALAAIVTALQTIVSRTVDPTHAVVVSICTIRAGNTFNVIAEDGILQGTLRTLDLADRTHAIERIHHITHHGARMHGCEATVDFKTGCAATVNDATATEQVRAAVRDVSGTTLVEMPVAFMGGEDFASYGERVAASFFLLGIQANDASALSALHHPTFDFNDDAIGDGVETMCRIALGSPGR